ncbi:MAG: FmdB family zinc ribbon protein [Myxococcota bacterium]
MPIYEYRCPECGNEFEKLQKISDPIPQCPTCGAGEVKKKVSASAFVLKGGGWYKDGYSKPAAGSSSSSGSSSDGGGSSTPSAPTTPSSDS